MKSQKAERVREEIAAEYSEADQACPIEEEPVWGKLAGDDVHPIAVIEELSAAIMDSDKQLARVYLHGSIKKHHRGAMHGSALTLAAASLRLARQIDADQYATLAEEW